MIVRRDGSIDFGVLAARIATYLSIVALAAGLGALIAVAGA